MKKLVLLMLWILYWVLFLITSIMNISNTQYFLIVMILYCVFLVPLMLTTLTNKHAFAHILVGIFCLGQVLIATINIIGSLKKIGSYSFTFNTALGFASIISGLIFHLIIGIIVLIRFKTSNCVLSKSAIISCAIFVILFFIDSLVTEVTAYSVLNCFTTLSMSAILLLYSALYNISSDEFLMS